MISAQDISKPVNSTKTTTAILLGFVGLLLLVWTAWWQRNELGVNKMTSDRVVQRDAIVSTDSGVGAGPEIRPPQQRADDAQRSIEAQPEVFYAIVSDPELRQRLTVIERMLTPRFKGDLDWMLRAGYPKLRDIQTAPDYETPNDVPVNDGMYAMNVAIAKKIQSGDPAWREFAETALTASAFAARLLLEDSLVLQMDNRGKEWRRSMERYLAASILLGDSEATIAVRSSGNNPYFRFLSGHDLEAIVRSQTFDSSQALRRGRPVHVVEWRPLPPRGG